MTILDKLKNNKNFTDTEKQVVNYLLNHFDQIDSITINQLAKETYTSHSTIIRVCQKLSLKGFRDLKMRLIQEREANKFLTKKSVTAFLFNTMKLLKILSIIFILSIKKAFIYYILK